MSDDTKELNFKITTNAELGGFQDVANSLERQIGMAKALGKDYSALSEQLKSVRASMQEYTEAQRAQSAVANDVIEVTKADIAAAEADALATNELAISKRELREAIHGLGLEFPELDRLVHVVTSSVGIAFGSVAAAVGIWVERMRDANAEAQRFEFPDVAQMIKPIQEVTAAWNGLADAIQRANDNYSSAEQSADRAIKKIHEQLTQERELIGAEKELALAKLESQKGSMSPEEYAKERGQIENAFGNANVAANEKARRAEETVRANEATNLDVKARQEAAASKRLPQASPETEKQDEEALKKALEDLGKKIEDQQKVVDAGRANLQSAINAKTELGGGEIGAGLHDVVNASLGIGTSGWGFLGQVLKGYGLDDPMAKQKFEEDQLKVLQGQLDNVQKSLDTRQSRIKERDELRNSASKDEQSAQTIRNQLPDQESSDAIANKTDEAVQKIHEHTEQLRQHIERMGNATTQGLKTVGNQIAEHTKAIENINDTLLLHSQAISRATYYANGPT